MPTPRRAATTALVVWTFFVWTTRIGNIWGDDALTAGEKWGRTGLALSFTVLAIAVAWALWRRPAWLRTVVLGLAGWTVAVWAVRSVGIALGDHGAGFITVHLVLAAVSIALAVLAVREASWQDTGAEPRAVVNRSETAGRRAPG
jgi:hypothetical protein